MGFDSSGRHTGYYRYFFYRQVLHKEQSDACSLCFFQSAQSPIYVHLLAYLGLFHLAGGIYFPLFQSRSLFLAANIVIKYIIGNTIKPGGEAGEVFERAQIGVCLQESFLCQVIAQFFIAQCLVEEETPGCF